MNVNKIATTLLLSLSVALIIHSNSIDNMDDHLPIIDNEEISISPQVSDYSFPQSIIHLINRTISNLD